MAPAEPTEPTASAKIASAISRFMVTYFLTVKVVDAGAEVSNPCVDSA